MPNRALLDHVYQIINYPRHANDALNNHFAMLREEQKTIDLSNVHLGGIDLHDIDFSQAVMQGADLFNANLSGVNFLHTDLRDVDFQETTGLDEITDYEFAVFSKNTKLPDHAPDWMVQLAHAAEKSETGYAIWIDEPRVYTPGPSQAINGTLKALEPVEGKTIVLGNK